MVESASASAEDARAYLQARLLVLYRLMFWCFLVLGLFLWAIYEVNQDIRPRHNNYVYLAFGTGLTIMAAIWRGALARRVLSIRVLNAIDAFFVIGTETIIAACGVASYDQRQAAYTCLLYGCFAVLTRALIVPSTFRRTAIVTSLGGIPMMVTAVVLTQISNWPGPKDVPAPGFVIGFVQIEVVAVLLCALGSDIIYGLRRKVSVAKHLGQYTLVRQIGEGGMGVVYLAHHALLRRPTAIKVIHPDRVGHDSVQRFVREVSLMSQLTHPNTVAVYDYGHSAAGGFYYAMEYLGGGIDLEHLVRAHGPQPAERVRQIVIQVCGALQEAHESGLVHRDIKPANIILCERGAIPDVAKVVDFGLVKEVTANTGNSTQVVLGTPAYLAPEAILDPSGVKAPADIYAVGAVAYFLLSGRRVFEGKTSLEVCIQHVTKAPSPPSEQGPAVPPALEAIVMACLAKQAAERPESAAALADALATIGPFVDWDEARATQWWRDLPPRERAGAAEAPATITIDIAKIRDEAE